MELYQDEQFYNERFPNKDYEFPTYVESMKEDNYLRKFMLEQEDSSNSLSIMGKDTFLDK